MITNKNKAPAEKREYIEKIASIGVLIIIIPILMYLTYYSMRSTMDYGNGNWIDGKIYHQADSIRRNALAIIGVGYIAFILSYFKNYLKKKAAYGIVICSLICIDVVMSFFILSARIESTWDQRMIYEAAEAIISNNKAYWSGYSLTYFSMYKQQFGMVFVEELLLRICNNYLVIQIFNVLIIDAVLIFIFLVTEELFDDYFLSLMAFLITFFSIYIYIYAFYMYSDLIMTASSLIMIWAYLKLYKKERKIYLYILVFATSFGVMIRKNTIIVAISICISLMVNAFKKKKLSPLILALVLMLLSILPSKLLIKSYEHRMDMILKHDLPATSWIYEGLLESWGGNGMWGGAADSLYSYYSDDEQELKRVLNARISERFNELTEDSDHFIYYYEIKALEQWIEPTFSAYNSVGIGIKENKDNRVVQLFFYGDSYKYQLVLLKRLQFIIYAFSLFGIIALTYKLSFKQMVPLIAVIGGFLFSLIWENKPRYVMTFFMLLIPYAAYGCQMIISIIKKQYRWCKENISKGRAE